jgi:hypothetical protein
LTKHLSPNASYLGIDLSRTMIDIAERRIAPNAQRESHSIGRVLAFSNPRPVR